MAKRAELPKKFRNMRTGMVELYKNNNFVSDSLSSFCVSSVKITADGEMTTKNIGNLCDRHMTPQLELPSLAERCAISTKKDLYKISQLLAPPKLENQSDNKKTKEQDTQIKARKGHKYQNNNLAVSKLDGPDSTRYKLKQIYSIAEDACKSNKTTDKPHKTYKGYKLPKESPLQNVKKHQKKTKRTTIEFSKSSSSYADDIFNITARNSEDFEDKTQVTSLPHHLAKVQPVEKPKQEIIRSQSNPYEFRVLNFEFKKLDDWYPLTLLLILGVAAYLIYILYFDVNVHVNEERHFQNRLRKTPIVVKWLYYLLRRLKLPIAKKLALLVS